MNLVPKPRISVVLPVRSRSDRVDPFAVLDRMLTSCRHTVSDLAAVEVIMRADREDDRMIGFLRGHGFSFIVGPRLGGYANLATFINEAARLARADLLLVGNDDMEFVTQDWDLLLEREAGAFADGIFNIGVETLNADNFPFPCVSRKLVNTLGGIYDERLIYTDIWLRDVCSVFGRAIRARDIVIRHNWTGMTQDQANAERKTHSEAYSALYAQAVQEAIQKLKEVVVCSE